MAVFDSWNYLLRQFDINLSWVFCKYIYIYIGHHVSNQLANYHSLVYLQESLPHNINVNVE